MSSCISTHPLSHLSSFIFSPSPPEYVQIKPLLAILTVLLKSLNLYQEGVFSRTNGYTYISLLYNLSVFISLYSLGILWSCLSSDLSSFNVTSKFLCIKGIIFFSFWQSLLFSFLVSPIQLITHLGSINDAELLPIALQDSTICIEMILFSIWHSYAFNYRDYIERYNDRYQSRLPALFALRDTVGGKDVWYDSVTTIRGTGYHYRAFEPSQGLVHAVSIVCIGN